MPSASPLDRALATFEELKKAWKAQDFAQCQRLMPSMKIALTHLALPGDDGAPSAKELLIAREALELGARCSVKLGDPASFERYIKQLKAYYFDASGKIPESSYMHELLGLHLLCLLSQNRIAEFHTELERLDPSLLQDNIYIRHPVNMEQYLMEGAYNKVYLSRFNVPAESYVFFIDILIHTLRKEIAECSAASYDTLLVSAAARILLFENPKDVLAFAAENDWTVQGDYVIFPPKAAPTTDLPAQKVIERTLGYALQLDRIV